MTCSSSPARIRTQEEFFHTFNALVDQNKQIIISADRAPGEIKDLEERIKSPAAIGPGGRSAPDRLRAAPRHPADQGRRATASSIRDLEIADGVLEFLAHRISTNVRVLEGALMRLFAFASLVGREITLEMAQDCLADILRASDRKVTVEEIQRKVAEHYNIRMSDMIGPEAASARSPGRGRWRCIWPSS